MNRLGFHSWISSDNLLVCRHLKAQMNMSNLSHNFSISSYIFIFLLLDCGAGIGRVTKHLLLPLFKNVDMVEQDRTFVDKAPMFLVNISCTHVLA